MIIEILYSDTFIATDAFNIITALILKERIWSSKFSIKRLNAGSASHIVFLDTLYFLATLVKDSPGGLVATLTCPVSCIVTEVGVSRMENNVAENTDFQLSCSYCYRAWGYVWPFSFAIKDFLSLFIWGFSSQCQLQLIVTFYTKIRDIVGYAYNYAFIVKLHLKT